MFTGILARNIYYFQKINKIVSSAREAVSNLKSGSKVLVGGFGICGVPMNLINAVKETGVNDLTVVSNNCGMGNKTG